MMVVVHFAHRDHKNILRNKMHLNIDFIICGCCCCVHNCFEAPTRVFLCQDRNLGEHTHTHTQTLFLFTSSVEEHHGFEDE